MQGVQILGESGRAQVTLSKLLDRPVPKDDEILLHVHSAGITGDELGWTEVYKPENKRIPGHDVSGVITELGPEYRGQLVVGDSVFAMLDAGRGMGQAEYTIVKPNEAARKPASLTHAQAAALPIPVVTAWEALFRHAESKPGARILVTGASGAVGRILVQIAKHLLHSHVVALASTQKHSTLKQLGADEVVDYNSPEWEMRIGKVDAVFDTAGGEILSKSWHTVKPKGTIVTVADPPPPWALHKDTVPTELTFAPDVRHVYFVISPDNVALERVGNLIDEGAVKTLPVVEYPAQQAVEAWSVARQRNRQGKVVINFVPAEAA